MSRKGLAPLLCSCRRCLPAIVQHPVAEQTETCERRRAVLTLVGGIAVNLTPCRKGSSEESRDRYAWPPTGCTPDLVRSCRGGAGDRLGRCVLAAGG